MIIFINFSKQFNFIYPYKNNKKYNNLFFLQLRFVFYSSKILFLIQPLNTIKHIFFYKNMLKKKIKINSAPLSINIIKKNLNVLYLKNVMLNNDYLSLDFNVYLKNNFICFNYYNILENFFNKNKVPLFFKIHYLSIPLLSKTQKNNLHKNQLLFNRNMFNFYNSFVFINFFINFNLNMYFKYLIKSKFIKLKKLNLSSFLNNILVINDFNYFTNFKKLNYSYMSNNFFFNFFNFFDQENLNVFQRTNPQNFILFNNYYPVFSSNKIIFKNFFLNVKNSYNVPFILFTHKFVISFLEKNFSKLFFIKYINNRLNKFNSYHLESIFYDYKNFQPAYWKNFLVNDFISILWYSFFLKDISIISNWVSIFMETLNFKNHKKFLNFFLNFINKYADVFLNVLRIKGFFFDIRGKVGVTGSSKKRHLFFKFGSINKSSKKTKINICQSLVRTYSGVMGLTYIINY